MQRGDVISSASDFSDEQDFAISQNAEEIQGSDPVKQVFALGRMKRLLNPYSDKVKINQYIDELDSRLLKGVYTTDKWEHA